MLRTALLVAAAVLLAGCESYGDLTSDAFDPGSTSQSAFAFDSAQCQSRANDARNYEVRGITGTHVERHLLFNRAYIACMRKAGYARRDWSPDVADPYAVDPTPG